MARKTAKRKLRHRLSVLKVEDGDIIIQQPHNEWRDFITAKISHENLKNLIKNMGYEVQVLTTVAECQYKKLSLKELRGFRDTFSELVDKKESEL